QPGARCAVEPYLNCGRCIACQQGKTNCCVELRLIGVHIDGGMRESILVPSNKLHESNVLQTDQLALVEMLGIGAHAVDRANLAKGETALVIGAGPIGLSVIQFAQIAGARVILMEVSQTRIAFCKSQFGVEEVIQAGENALGELRDLLGGELPTAVFDATGNPNSMNAAFQYVANGGRLVFVGLVQSDITFFDPEFHRREITLLATRNSLSKDFVRIVRLMEEGTVDTRPWITHGATFEDFVEQFPAWLEPEQGVVKAMLTL
ncbi:MAG: zinc-binding dehydrogenase, partial [bacterium]|nr:zinc-binding dehydrogenase [bacterium]